jgi:hypothetical protein
VDQLAQRDVLGHDHGGAGGNRRDGGGDHGEQGFGGGHPQDLSAGRTVELECGILTAAARGGHVQRVHHRQQRIADGDAEDDPGCGLVLLTDRRRLSREVRSGRLHLHPINVHPINVHPMKGRVHPGN